MYLYRGVATPMSSLTSEQAAERMAAFGAWMKKLGPALADGLPFLSHRDGTQAVEIFQLLPR